MRFWEPQAWGISALIFHQKTNAGRTVESSLFLTDVVRQVLEKGFQIENIDAIVYAERPRLAAHAPKMRARLCRTARHYGIGSEHQGKDK